MNYLFRFVMQIIRILKKIIFCSYRVVVVAVAVVVVVVPWCSVLVVHGSPAYTTCIHALSYLRYDLYVSSIESKSCP